MKHDLQLPALLQTHANLIAMTDALREYGQNGVADEYSRAQRATLKQINSLEDMTMKGLAEFQLIGRVGDTKRVGSTLRISVASEYGRRNDDGEFETNPYWNEVTVFEKNRVKWLEHNLGKGDLIHARGTVKQSKWEANGTMNYGVTLAANDLSVLSKKTVPETEDA